MPRPLPPDYENRVYAGVLGKLIGVYLGRPFEGASYDRITGLWGEIRRYVHADKKVPLIVTDDDITGTFTFVRALLDHGIRPDLSAREIGQTWLNYIAENKHILWWGGIGMSAEHTAYLRLDAGIDAPASGSIALNGTAVAEEIGAQIFIDGWAMVAPGNPDLAVRLAREAARVSHDGEAVHGAVVIAAMESLAFVERDIETLLDRALAHIPADCEIARLIADLRRWHRDGLDWRRSRELLVEHYGYQKYGTNCPMVSNHGVIILALLHGAGDFDRSMMIVNTCGYDTDCNSGNLGCLLGIRNGLDTLRSGYDWRTPVNDRMFLPAADGHWGVRDAATMALELANIGRRFAGEAPRQPKQGARFHFDLPGATHGFAPSPLCPTETRVIPIESALRLESAFPGARCDAEVFTFVPPDALDMAVYAVTATPTLYPGQTVTARITAPPSNAGPVQARLFVRAHADDRGTALREGPLVDLPPGGEATLEWLVPESGRWPIFSVGIQLVGPADAQLDLDWLTWAGTPALTFDAPDPHRQLLSWQRMFAHNLEEPGWGWHRETGSLIKNRGRGLIHTGAREWRNYRVSSTLTPMVAAEFGIAGRVQGLTRHYALVLRPDNRLLLIRMEHEETVLAETRFDWTLRTPYAFSLELRGDSLAGLIDGARRIEARDAALVEGGLGVVVANGRVKASALTIDPL
jgi:ADP-ribosylglycohydrolase